jgi:hypothetical protein
MKQIRMTQIQIPKTRFTRLRSRRLRFRFGHSGFEFILNFQRVSHRGSHLSTQAATMRVVTMRVAICLLMFTFAIPTLPVPGAVSLPGALGNNGPEALLAGDR